MKKTKQKDHRSRRWILILVLVGGSGLVAFLLTNRSVYEVDQLEELLKLFEQKTRCIHKGRRCYPLPKIEAGRAEVAYLERLADLMETYRDDCSLAAKLIKERYSTYHNNMDMSVFFEAARTQKRKQGQDFVHNISEQITPGLPSYRRRPTEPLSVDERLKALQEKTDRINLVNRAAAVMRGVIAATEDFIDACPEEADVIQTALKYFLVDSSPRPIG